MNSSKVSTLVSTQVSTKQPPPCARARNVTTGVLGHALKVAAIAAAAFAIFGLVTGTYFGLPFIPFVILAAVAMTGGAVSSAMLVRQIYVACMNRPADKDRPADTEQQEKMPSDVRHNELALPTSPSTGSTHASPSKGVTHRIPEDDEKTSEVNDGDSSGSPESRSSTPASLPNLIQLPPTLGKTPDLIAEDIFDAIKQLANGSEKPEADSEEACRLLKAIGQLLLVHPEKSLVVKLVSGLCKAEHESIVAEYNFRKSQEASGRV